MDNQEVFDINQPFVTQEQKFKYWEESKRHIRGNEQRIHELELKNSKLEVEANLPLNHGHDVPHAVEVNKSHVSASDIQRLAQFALDHHRVNNDIGSDWCSSCFATIDYKTGYGEHKQDCITKVAQAVLMDTENN